MIRDVQQWISCWTKVRLFSLRSESYRRLPFGSLRRFSKSVPSLTKSFSITCSAFSSRTLIDIETNTNLSFVCSAKKSIDIRKTSMRASKRIISMAIWPKCSSDKRRTRKLVSLVSIVTEVQTYWCPQSVDTLKANCRAFFGAGSETVRTTTEWCLLLAAHHLEHQKRIHEEIDCVIGADRSPAWTDRSHMPFTQAFINEMWRWKNTIPLNLMRRYRR